MRRHGVGREEETRSPLDIHALQGIGIVGDPEFIEVGQQAVVGASPTRCAVLDDDIGIFGADALEHLQQSQVVVHIEVRLLVHRQIQRPHILYRGIGIPLQVGNLRILRQEVIDNLKREVLYLGIRHVEHQLRTTTAQFQFTALGLQCPFGVTLEEFALRIDGFGFYPDAKLDAFLGS